MEWFIGGLAFKTDLFFTVLSYFILLLFLASIIGWIFFLRRSIVEWKKGVLDNNPVSLYGLWLRASDACLTIFFVIPAMLFISKIATSFVFDEANSGGNAILRGYGGALSLALLSFFAAYLFNKILFFFAKKVSG